MENHEKRKVYGQFTDYNVKRCWDIIYKFKCDGTDRGMSTIDVRGPGPAEVFRPAGLGAKMGRKSGKEFNYFV